MPSPASQQDNQRISQNASQQDSQNASSPLQWHADHPAFQIALARRMLAREGCESQVAGHVSVRDAQNPEEFWVSTFGYFDETLPEHVIKLNFQMEQLEGTWTPSPAVAFHASLFAARPEARSVVHTHSRWLQVLSTTGSDIGMFTTEAALFYNDQAHYIDDGVQTPVDGERMARQLSDKRVLIMDNHGAVVVETSLIRATIKAIALESSAFAQVHAGIVSGKPMPDAEAARSQADYHKYYIPMMWEANCRRLRKTDPDLFAQLAT